jgi:hypothetical protein
MLLLKNLPEEFLVKKSKKHETRFISITNNKTRGVAALHGSGKQITRV